MVHQVSTEVRQDASGLIARRRAYVPMLVLVLMALAIRLLFFVGYQGRDDRNYLSYALYVESGNDLATLDVKTQWIGRIGFWIPTTGSIALFGRNDLGYTAYPLICSLAGVILALALGGMTVGRRAGILAAAMLTIVPLDVLYATKAYPDLPLGVMLTASFVLMLRSRALHRSFTIPFAAGLLLGAAYLHKETALFACVPIAVALTFWRPDHRRKLAIAGTALALVLLAEAGFWFAAKGDPLYRFHAADTVLDRVVSESHDTPLWRLPGPKPTEIYRSENSLLDAALMLGFNEEFGLLYWFVVPLLVLGAVTKDQRTRDLRMWIVTLLPLILFFPVHWPLYTMPRDPRYLTSLTIPALLILASYLLRLNIWMRSAALLSIVITGVLGTFLGKESSIMEPQRMLLSRAQAGEQLWLTPQFATDLVIMSGMEPGMRLGMHLLEQGRGAGSFQAAMLLQPDIPVADTADEIHSGTLVLRGRNADQAPQEWSLVGQLVPQPSGPNALVQSLLRAAGLSSFARKLAPGGGETALLYRKDAARGTL